MLTQEQKRRADRCKVSLYRGMRQGTLDHCKRLWLSGMKDEALEIGRDFNINEEEINGRFQDPVLDQ